MRAFVGIDLGSTTTKAVVLGEGGEVLGRGITNSRSNYKVACDVALCEALIDARFGRVAAGFLGERAAGGAGERALAELERRFREQQYQHQLDVFGQRALAHAAANDDAVALRPALESILGAPVGAPLAAAKA